MTRLALAACVASIAVTATAGTWDEIGTGSGGAAGIAIADGPPPSGNYYSSFPSLAISDLQRPTLVWLRTNRSLDNVVMARQWDGENWLSMGNSTEPEGLENRYSGFLSAPGVVAQGDSGPWCAWAGTVGGTSTTRVFGRTYLGTAWQQFADSARDPGVSRETSTTLEIKQPAVACTAQGIPYVAWSSGVSGQEEIHVRTLAGQSWAGLAGSELAPGISNHSGSDLYPTICFYKGQPAVGWRSSIATPIDAIAVMRYDGTAWVPLANSTTPSFGFGTRPKLAPGTGNSLWLAFEESASGRLTVREFDGFAWFDRGNALTPWGFTRLATGKPAFGTTVYPAFDMAVDRSGRPVVVFRATVTLDGYTQSHVYASYLAQGSTTWERLGGEGDVAGLSTLAPDPGADGHVMPRVVIGLDNRPLVCWAFRRDSLTETILARRWSEPLPQDRGSLGQATGRVCGRLDPNEGLDDLLDESRDNTIDAADVIRLRRVP